MAKNVIIVGGTGHLGISLANLLTKRIIGFLLQQEIKMYKFKINLKKNTNYQIKYL